METPAQKIEKILKAQFEKFLKTPFVIPAGIALSAGIYLVVIAYLSGFCLGGLITPLAMVGMFWFFGVKSVKKLVIIGAVAAMVFAAVMTVYLPYTWQGMDAPVIENDSGSISDGTVSPIRGDATTVYNFTVTMNVADESLLQDVRVIVIGVGYFTDPEVNVSMDLMPGNYTNATSFGYYYETSVPNPMNLFAFGAWINGSWVIAGDLGPVSNDTGAIMTAVFPAALMQSYVSVFPIYLLLLLMIWWTRRARKMRVNAYEKAVSEREKEQEGVPKDEKKVSSLAKAMGLEKESFVCSECGSDVPGDATVCPKCGEKFD
jgi:ribosomal protein L40E